MQTALNKIANSLWLLLVVTIILGGVLVSMARLASPYLKNYKPNVESELSRLTGTPVAIGDLEARWQGLGPVLQLRDITFGASDEVTPAVRLERVDLDLSLRSFLRHGRLLPQSIILHGIQLRLQRNPDGRFEISGLLAEQQVPIDTAVDSGISDESSDAELPLEPLLQMPRIEMKDTVINWRDKTGRTPDADFGQVQLLLRNEGNRHQANLSFNLPGQKTQAVQVATDLRFEPGELKQAVGDIYLMTRNFNVTAWLRELMPASFSLERGITDSDLWLRLEDGRLVSMQGQTRWRELRLKLPERPDAVDVTEASALIHLQHQQPGNWQLDIDDFRLSAERLDWPSTRLRYRREAQSGTYLSISHVEASLWQSLATTLLPVDLPVPAMELDGQVKNFHARWDPDLTRWYSEGELAGFSVITASLEQPVETPDQPEPAAETKKSAIGTPGIRNLSGRFIAADSGGMLEIDSRDTQYLHPGLFRNAIDLQVLNGTLHWQPLETGGWLIETDYLQAISPHISSATRARIELPNEGNKLLDIQTDFRDGDGSHAKLYYPVGIMNDKLVSWLDRAIISGRVTSGSMVLKGPVQDFAFSKTRNGRFEVLFNVEDTVVDYLPEWPRLEEAEAEVHFFNDSMEIKLANAKMLDTEVLNARAFIDTLKPLSPLQISGTTTGPASDNLRMLSETPLREDFARVAEILDFEGDSKVSLDFQVPLGKLGDYTLDGEVAMQDNRLQLKGWDLEIDDIDGALNFSLDGLSAKGIRGKLLNTPIEIDIVNDAKKRTRFQTSAKLSLRQMQKLVGSVPTDIIAGTTRWNVDLLIPPLNSSDQPAELVITSNLQGVAINAPEPLLKTATTRRELEVKAKLLPGSDLPLTIHYDNLLHTALLLDISKDDNPHLKAGELLLGKGQPKIPDSSMFSVKGRIEQLHLDEWLKWSVGLTRAQAEGERLPIAIDLSAGNVSFHDFNLEDISLAANIDGGSLLGTVSSEQLNGRITIPDYSRFDRLKIDLDTLALTHTFDAEAQTSNTTDDTASSETPADIDPSSLPSLALKVEQVKINDKVFGTLNLQTTSSEDELRVDQFELDGKKLTLTANGLWTANRNGQRSSLDFSLDSDNFGRVVKQLGFPLDIAKGEADFDGNLNWPGGPHQFSLAGLSGQLSLILKEARFREIKPGVGRLLGLTNLSALGRRLTLDFSDLFKEGFFFDEISADYDLDNGDAYTNNMLFKSTSAEITLSGRTGLGQKDFDQLVTVTPSLQSSITLAGAAAGGPAGAAIGFLAQKLIGNQVDKMGRTQYGVTGSWQEPQVKKIGAKDTSEDSAEEENNNIFSDL